jgi:hypothetical protein
MTGYGVGFPQEIDTELITEVNKIILDLQEEVVCRRTHALFTLFVFAYA